MTDKIGEVINHCEDMIGESAFASVKICESDMSTQSDMSLKLFEPWEFTGWLIFSRSSFDVISSNVAGVRGGRSVVKLSLPQESSTISVESCISIKRRISPSVIEV